MRYLIALIFSILLFFSFGEEATAQTLPTQTYSHGEEPVEVPDWSQINFSLLPPIQASGYLNLTANLITQLGYNPSRSWQAGDAVASFLMLGDVQAAFRLEEFSLQNTDSVFSSGSRTTRRDRAVTSVHSPSDDCQESGFPSPRSARFSDG